MQVRVTLVCDGPAQILEILGWFTTEMSTPNKDSMTGLGMLPTAVRVKNGFAASLDEVVDGYRDVKVPPPNLLLLLFIQLCSLADWFPSADVKCT